MSAPGRSPALAYHKVRFPYDPRRAGVWRVIAQYLQPWIAPAHGVLELGAGYGEFSRQVRADRKWAMDLTADLAEHWGGDVQPLIQSALDPWPLPGASVSTVFASNFFEHFTQQEAVVILREAARVLRPEGRLITVQPNFRLEPRRYFDDYTHRSIYTDQGFQDFLRSLGWQILRCEPRFLPFTMKSRLPAAEWLVRLYLASPIRPLAGQMLVIAQRPEDG